ncbi:MAG: hypothetical protein HQ472_10705 [Ignavibacteria bacterium]|nr:hypothetical protein [Ignavibacteria bacterium]
MFPASAQWVKATLPGTFDRGYYLDVMFLPSDPNYGWACSIEGYVVRTTDAGVTWRGTQLSQSFLESVQFLSRTVGYTSGPGGIFKSTDGGFSFRNITPFDPNQEKSWGCYFINENEGVFLVGGCATSLLAFYKTTNGGNSWKVSYVTEPNSGLSDAILYKDGSGFAVSSGVLWRTFDYGSSWDFYKYTGAKYWTEELAIYKNSFLLPTAGNNCDGSDKGMGTMRFSVDAGNTWREYQTNNNMFGSFLVNDFIGWGVGDNAEAVVTADAGRTWQLRNCGLEGDLDDIWFVNDTLAWITGSGLFKSNFNAKPQLVSIRNNPRDVTVCEGDSVFVQANDGLNSYSWSDGAKAQARYLTKPGQYIITAIDKLTCFTSADTITLAIKPAEIPVIKSITRSVCEGDSIVLKVTGPYVKFAWSTTEQSDSIVVRKSGTYTVTTVDTGGCIKKSAPYTVTIHPNPTPTVTANAKTRICLDETVTLSAPPGYAKYKWSTGDETQTIVVSAEGTYYVTVIDVNGCVGISNKIDVVVLNTRNKVEVIYTTVDRVITVPSMAVGAMECTDVTIKNKSEDENLVIQRISALGNVLCSVPVTQFPLILRPLSIQTFRVCCSAIDSGLVLDSIIIPDTCSPTIVPVVSRGLPIALNGSSKCSVPIGTLIYKAGSAHQLFAPFPQPSWETVTFRIEPAIPVTASVVSPLGVVVIPDARVYSSPTDTSISVNVDSLPNGTYLLQIASDGIPVSFAPFVVFR